MKIITDKEIANGIRETLVELDIKVRNAKACGIMVDLRINTACVLSDAPIIQADIYEKRKL